MGTGILHMVPFLGKKKNKQKTYIYIYISHAIFTSSTNLLGYES